MAYTSVIPVRRLDRAVKYVMNKEKTTAVSLQDALDYAANRDKTEQSCFESSYACTLETAFADMRQTKERWHKSGGVQGYHLVQSFAAGEVTPELAHQIAKELAARVLGGRYEYVIGTHLNTGHIHSHIVWNSVSRIDGKKYHSNGKSYVTEIRAVSDELCRKYKLSVIDTENSNHVAKPYAEWLAEKNGQPTWRTAIRQDVDEAIQQSLTWRQFLSAMERKGYEVRMGRKYPVLRPPGKERFVRFKTLGKRYTPEAIQTRILYPQSYHPYVENPPTIQHGRLHSGKKPHRKLTGLRALYYRYLYELGALPRKPRRPSYAVRQDAYKLDQRIRQMEFLSRNNIDTLTQLETHRQALQTEIGQLLTKRKQLPKTDEVQSQHESVNTALKQLRQEERLCRKIAEHSLEVQQHLTEARRDRAEQQQREQEHERDRRPNIDLTL
ncbi:relaxase/mobilization nuclease domain-containing protein [Hominenteromicrobium sp.]|uniref:relaxase/mobilization nuclease domain-containing protein n=1 Tax=Hominenteromicrobium sp. TaxID=3073581 RepID=UPI003AF1CA6C